MVMSKITILIIVLLSMLFATSCRVDEAGGSLGDDFRDDVERQIEYPVSFEGTGLAWSNDGKYIAYCREDGIYLYSVAANSHVLISPTDSDRDDPELVIPGTIDGFYDAGIIWSPDSQYLAYNLGAIYLYSIKKGEQKKIVDNIPALSFSLYVWLNNQELSTYTNESLT